ncbi:hypothetical protein M8C21_006367 [Ambrosia artemisiifolia]|uniref:Uncharacterized protein n=1 Tax=Ambrosia artemisiifolia TaxID=4212 RepID=A0AAD5G4F8_AMBAR|nr:hypothetical protein M8C21_006367 [Ambrosia artemisiifolia]
MGCNGSVSAATHGVDEAVVDIGVPVVRLGFTATDGCECLVIPWCRWVFLAY